MAIGIRDIAAADNYVGTPQLGGSLDYAISIDTKPIEQLSLYTMYAHKDAQEKREKETQAKIKELANITAIDWQNAIPKEKEEALKVVNELTEYAKSYATKQPKNDAERITSNLDWQTKLNEAKKKVAKINSRFITYGTWNERIENAATPELKAYYEKERDKAVNSTTVNDDLPTLPKYDLKQPDISAPQRITFDVGIFSDDGKFIRDRKIDLPSMADVNSQANAITLGLRRKQLDVNSDEFKKLTPEEQKYAKQQYDERDAAGTLSTLEESKTYNEALASYMVDGKVDIDRLKSKNTVLAGVMEAMDRYNEQVRTMREEIKAGAYRDKTGKAYQFGMGNLRESDYQEISYLDGDISPEDLLKVQILAKAAPVKYDTDTKVNTGATDRAEMALKWYDARTRRINATTPSKSSSSGSDKQVEVIDKPAFLFGQNVERTKEWFRKGNADLVVKAKSVDPYTSRAAGIKDGEEIVYYPDGSYIVRNEKTKEKVSQNTVENLAQGYINAVKAIDFSSEDQKDASMAEGFQLKSENKFKQIWGTSSGKNIWDNWGNSQQPTNNTGTSSSGGTKTISASTIKGLVGKAGYEGYTENELINYYKSNGYTIK